MNRLRIKLILAFTLVVLVAVGAIAILIFRTTDTEFRQYITHSGMQASGSGLQQLVAYYEEQGSWDGVESILDRGVFVIRSGDTSMPIMGQRPPWPGAQLEVTLADANRRVVYDSSGTSVGNKLKSGAKSRALAIEASDGSEIIGYLLLSFPGDRDRLGGLEQAFLDRMKQILIIGTVLAVGFSLAIGAVLSRSLTAPLQRLAAAARAVATGDLEQQVQLEGSVEMVEVARAFNDMTVALSESERQRQNMVADVAHELRTPLTVVQGNLQAILDEVYPLDKAEISRLYDETRLLSRLVDDLRELALADAGQLGLHARPTDLAQVIYSTVENLDPAAEMQQVSLGAQLGGELPVVQADPDRVAQVLRNLLINALRHTPPGGSVTVTASMAEEATLEAKGDASGAEVGASGAEVGAVEITVADTGEGISPEDLDHVFERFWQADPARTRQSRNHLGHASGTGLGLSVAQSLVRAQGGRMWAESTLGQGSTFHFTLPLA